MSILVRGLIIISGIWVFSSKREHLLSVLLRIEYVSLGIYIIFISFLGVGDLFYSLIYITFTACEGALALSILVIIRRTHGGDYFRTFNIM
jgi:NADH-ubiquinone oxidoreductase chain 4L